MDIHPYFIESRSELGSKSLVRNFQINTRNKLTAKCLLTFAHYARPHLEPHIQNQYILSSSKQNVLVLLKYQSPFIRLLSKHFCLQLFFPEDSVFVVCLVQQHRGVTPWQNPKGTFFKFGSANCWKTHFFIFLRILKSHREL